MNNIHRVLLGRGITKIASQATYFSVLPILSCFHTSRGISMYLTAFCILIGEEMVIFFILLFPRDSTTSELTHANGSGISRLGVLFLCKNKKLQHPPFV